MITLLRAKQGIPMVGGLVTLTVAANAGALAVYQISTSASMRGTKSFKLKRIVIRDTTAGGTNVHFGTGVAGAVVDAIPQMRTVANMEVIQQWDDEEAPEFTADLMAYADAIQVEIQVTVQEIG
jgi:ammonia channel protein AmtB